jgi:predicted nuclease of restriction endonuclease-like (RecB) superfamily
MSKPSKKSGQTVRRASSALVGYDKVLAGMVELLETARHAAARTVNAVMTASYWELGHRIVEVEQGGKGKAEYGEELIAHLAADLTKRFGRGFGKSSLYQMRAFYLGYPKIFQTAFGKSQDGNGTPIFQTAFGKSAPAQQDGTMMPVKFQKRPSGITEALADIARNFPLPWSAYIRLLSVSEPDARAFYETEALRCGWSVRQLDRQIATKFYERTLLSRNKAAMLARGGRPLPQDIVTPEAEIKDPFVLEFLDLKDEYSETDLEDALVANLERFLLELGGDFAFIARQRRLRIGDEWYRVDLLFFHRRLRCLVVIDLKVGKFTHADAGQMHLYLNYARQHWTQPGENPPVGLILCAEKDSAVAKYALEGLPNKVLAAEYKLALPDPDALADEIARTRKMLEARSAGKPKRRGQK